MDDSNVNMSEICMKGKLQITTLKLSYHSL
jgi:hypothetical protein